jgi:DNA-binding MarR family transcriptional regulator
MKTKKKLEKCFNFDCPGDQIHLLHEIMKVHQALLSVFSRVVGMPSSRLDLLRLLVVSYPEGIGIMDLAKRLGINAAAVTRQVKEIEAEHLISRYPDSSDGRRNYVKLTPEGVQKLEKFHQRGQEFETRLCKAISPNDMAATARVLAQVRAAIEEQ